MPGNAMTGHVPSSTNRNLLEARLQIAIYNLHVLGSSFFEPWLFEQHRFTRTNGAHAVIESARQPLLSFVLKRLERQRPRSAPNEVTK